VNTRKYLVVLTGAIWLLLANIAQAAPANPKVIHLLNRLSLGIRPGEIDRVQQLGVDKYIQQQLSPDSIVEPAILTDRLSRLDTINLSPAELFQRYNPNRQADLESPLPIDKKIQQQQTRLVTNQAIEARLWRSIYSQRQLNEVMVDFWYNHFNVYADKGIDKLWVGAYEQQAIRPHALGKFRDLLGATARHPAMLFYLDNWRNSVPNISQIRKKEGINENYARELMELHTLGVDGGYQQSDVLALAKIFTGWGFKQPGQKVPDGYSFYFNRNRHESSDKIFLNKTIAGAGIEEGEQALDLLAKHPSTARQISFKLAQYFVSDNPPKSLVSKLVKRFTATNGDIKLVLGTLFQSPEFWDNKYYGTKFKTPYQYAVSSIRSTGTELSNPRVLNDFLKQQGMPLYGCPTPNGYKNTQEAWLNPDSLTRRINYATNLAKGKLPISASATTVPNSPLPIQADLSKLMPIPVVDPVKLAATLGNNFSVQTQQSIASSNSDIRAALILGSPEFMRK
jgi:uncharacterized protein (DUF1800 family)